MQHLPRNLPQHRPVLSELSDRSREIFRLIMDTYFETGEPVGSRT
jgi:heat-inducible transcriptional repressor